MLYKTSLAQSGPLVGVEPGPQPNLQQAASFHKQQLHAQARIFHGTFFPRLKRKIHFLASHTGRGEGSSYENCRRRKGNNSKKGPMQYYS